MTEGSEKLSAYIDGELSDAECVEIEQSLEKDPLLAKELASLIAAEASAKQMFDAILNEPVPFGLVKSVKSAGEKAPHRETRLPLWTAMAAGIMMFVLGGSLGYLLKDSGALQPSQVANAGWLTQIADYHAVYAKQKRHLVEVPGAEAGHIEKWLGKSTNVAFSIPNLKAFDLTFEGARLLVAGGAPVAQLMYTDKAGSVIALCFKESAVQNAADRPAGPSFKKDTINGFDFVSWNQGSGTYTVVGPVGAKNLAEIAADAARRI